MRKLILLICTSIAAGCLTGCGVEVFSRPDQHSNSGVAASLIGAIRHSPDFYSLQEVNERPEIYIKSDTVTIEPARLSFRLPKGFVRSPDDGMTRINDDKDYIVLNRQISVDGGHADQQAIGILIQAGCAECHTACHTLLMLSEIDLPYIESIFTHHINNVPYSTAMGYRCRLNDAPQSHPVNIVNVCNHGTLVTIIMEASGEENRSFQDEFDQMVQSLNLLDIASRCRRSFDKIYREAKMGLSYRQIDLGRMYKDGICVPQDDSEAIRWFEIAEYSSSGKATFQLGLMHKNGLGTLKDQKVADQFFRKAADDNHAPALRLLAQQLLANPSSQNNVVEAAGLLQRAIAAGSLQAEVDLALLLMSGSIAPPDDEAAYELLNHAAFKACGEAQLHLAEFFAKGRIVSENRPLAHAWLVIAEANGVSIAANKRKELEKRMTTDELSEAQTRLRTMLIYSDVIKMNEYRSFDALFF